MININLVSAIVMFNILALLYQIIIEIFTILCRTNGMTMEKSRFQVISILTSTGFTTTESESMLITKRRRQLTQNMMLFSYIFNIVIVSTLVNVLISTSSTNMNEIGWGIGLTVVNLFIIFFVKQSHTFKKVLDKIVVGIAKRSTSKEKNRIIVYDNYGNEIIAEVEIYNLKDSMDNKTLKELRLKENFHIQILIIRRGEEIIEYIGADTKIQKNDVLIVFGKYKDIRDAFVRQIEKNNT